MTEQIVVIVGITFLVLISPGPDMLIVMRNTLLGGRNAGFVTSAGVLTGNFVHIAYCVLGIGWLISKSIVAFNVLKYAGAAYLVYLGISSFRSDTRPLNPTAGTSKRTDRGWFMQGFINNVLNPKGTLFYLGVFSVVITPDTSAAVTALLVLIMQGMCALFWLFFVFTLDHPLIRGGIDRFQQVVHRLFGALLIFLGIRVLMMEK